jgi:hypothetical protein
MDDDVTLSIKLDWAEQRLEEKEGLIASLRTNLEAVAVALQEEGLRNRALAEFQTTLTSEKNTAEAHVEELIREKSDLAAENASLRTVAKEASARASNLTNADALIDAATSVAGARAGGGVEAPIPSAEERLRASRLLVARLLAIIARAGTRVTDADLLGPPIERDRGVGGGARASAAAREETAMQRRELAEALVSSLRLQIEVEEVRSEGGGVRSPPPLPHLRIQRPGGEEASAGEVGAGDERYLHPLPAPPGRTPHGGLEAEGEGASGQREPAAPPAAPPPSRGFFASFFSLLVGDAPAPTAEQTREGEAEYYA